MALFGRKVKRKGQPDDSSVLGQGPSYAAPVRATPADGNTDVSVNVLPEPNLSIQEQWSVLSNRRVYNRIGEADWLTDNVERSQKEERFTVPPSGIPIVQRNSQVQPDTSYQNPEQRYPNPRVVRSASTYGFEREPFSNKFAHILNSDQFSMASNYRTFHILGMGADFKPRINTLRVEPTPQDLHVNTNTSAAAEPYVNYSSGSAPSYNRSFRLG